MTDLIMGWGLTLLGVSGIIALKKDYVPLCVGALVVGALLLQGS